MKCVGEQMVEYWSSKNMSIRNGSTEQQIEAFEIRYHVVLPPDMRDYFLHVDGMSEY